MSLKAITLYDCEADDDAELSFKKGDILINVVDASDEGWIEATKEGTNERGFVPRDYVEIKEPPKPPPRPFRKNSNGVKMSSSSTASPFAPPKIEIINNNTVDSERPPIISSKPKKLSTGALALFEGNGNNNKSTVSSRSLNKPAPPPKPKVFPIVNNIQESENEAEIVLPSVSERRKALEQQVKPSPLLPSTRNKSKFETDLDVTLKPSIVKGRSSERLEAEISSSPRPSDIKNQIKSQDEEDAEPQLLRPSAIKEKQKPVIPAKPIITPPILGIKPSLNKTNSTMPARNGNSHTRTSDSEEETSSSSNSLFPKSETQNKRPPLPPRKLSNSDSSEKTVTPPKMPPRPTTDSNKTTESVVSLQSKFNNRFEEAEAGAKSKAQDQAAIGARKGVSAGFQEGQNKLTQKFGRKLPGQDKIFKKAESLAQAEADKQARLKSNGSARGFSTPKLPNSIKGFKLPTSESESTSSSTPPPLPARKKSSNSSRSNRDNSPQIPPRPPQHNPFSEHNLSKGIPDDARERYEEVFEAKKNRNGYIDGDVVKDIYIKSRLDSKTLHKIWNLVDTDKNGRLTKEEFNAGMFLIDERLKGNPVPDKLPRGLFV
ncbi:7671_t:CDS:10 [Ambispora gerdemannii]|uniref:7671_t:CDS:1 n=1 Tax=Ambispora gerdemannii TaxID=144530 RepID=A0A9N9AEA4_9GLOM|nr:7671_t:CDS:10 [Ambispora gerdemannii]